MRLTEREREIIDLVVQGLMNINIAARLGVSENTVKSHLTRIYLKLNLRGADKREQLTKCAVTS